MPTTYNGIGTHYYGKKNVQSRPGTCPHCHRTGQLTSYDTRLWFVVVFIPIIPLGRKRIIDQCSSCRRHYVADMDKWETAKQLEVSGAMDKFRSERTPESAVAVHQQMLNFHQHEEAAEFRRTMVETFPDNAKIQAYLGDALTHLGRPTEAVPYYTRALELRPDLPEAKAGVAKEKIRAGRLDEARALLTFLQEPGAAQLYSLEPLELLARAYQRAGRHEESLALFATLQTALPHLTNVTEFRKLVKQSEKALGRTETQLPKKKFSWRGLFSRGNSRSSARSLIILGVIAALVGLGLVVGNEVIRRHRTVHIVNAYAQPATVQIDSSPAVPVRHGVTSITLPEGRHHATIRGPVQEEVEMLMRTDYFSRWGDDPAWVLNVGSAAILTSTTAHYARNPAPSSTQVHFGQPFEYLPTITHPFQALPQSVRMKETEERTLVDLQVYSGSGEGLVEYFVGEHQVGQALAAAEAWLRTHAEDESALRVYAATARANHEEARLEKTMRAGLSTKPVRIEWHRVYQGLHDIPAEHAALVAEYDGLLAADPNNSALLYLRGRIEDRRAAARDFFQRAIKADANNAFGSFGLGYSFMMAGDWASARPLLERAAKLRPNDRGFDAVLIHARLAQGDAADTERELRRRLTTDATDFIAAVRLIDALAVTNRAADIAKVSQAYERAALAKYGNSAKEAATAIKRYGLYAAGDFQGLEKSAATDRSPTGKEALFEAEIEEGRVADASRIYAAEKTLAADTINTLALATAQRMAGNAAEADRLLQHAGELLAHQSYDSAVAAALITSGRPPTLEDAQDIVVEPRTKAVLLTALIAKYPASRSYLAPLARALNVERAFPFHLIDRTATADH